MAHVVRVRVRVPSSQVVRYAVLSTYYAMLQVAKLAGHKALAAAELLVSRVTPTLT